MQEQQGALLHNETHGQPCLKPESSPGLECNRTPNRNKIFLFAGLIG